MDYVLVVEMMSVVAQHRFEGSAAFAFAFAAVEIFEGPGQKQSGTAGHAPSPSNLKCVGADGRFARKPLFLSRPTFAFASLRRLALRVRRIIFV
jgi:hypothetical protein